MNLLNAMSVFVRIVDAGSLAAAAEASDLSPAMVGNHLRSLEQHVGMTLLTRTTRSQNLTEFGKVYYARCLDILDLVADTDTLAQQSKAVPRGRLRVNAPHAFGAGWLMPALADYARENPQVDIDLVLDDHVADLVDDDFEAAICIGEVADEDVITRPLSPFALQFCATPGYLAAHGEPREPADLAAHDCLFYTYGRQRTSRIVKHQLSLTGPEGPVDVAVAARIHVNSAIALRQAALSGIGIGLLPDAVIADDLEQGALVAVLADYAPPRQPIHLIYRRDRRITPKLRSFIDFVVARFTDPTRV